MILSWLSRVCATILVPLLLVATVGFTLSQTVFQGQYIKSELHKVNAYNKLSDSIVQEAMQSNDASGLPKDTVRAQLKTIITPAALETKIDTTIDHFVNYSKGKGPAPTLDVSDLVAQTQAIGLPAPTDPKLRQPIAIPAADKVKQASDTVRNIVTIGSLVTGLLLITMLVIATVRRNFKPIANLIISLGVFVLLTGIGTFLLPTILIKIGAENNGFVNVGTDLATAMARDIGKRLLITGVIYEVIGISTRLIVGKLSKPKIVPELFRDDTPRPLPQAPLTTAAPVPEQKPPVRKIQL